MTCFWSESNREVSKPSKQELLILAAAIAVLIAALAGQAWRAGITVDEPGHLISAHFYWHANDVLKPGDLPPLIKLVGGWPSLFFKLPIPYDYPAVWNSQQEAPIAAETIVRMGDLAARKLFFVSRMTLAVFPVLTTLLLWYWGRQLFSPAAGLIIAFLFIAEPTALGHGSLFKNDHAAAFAYFFFWYRAWLFWRSPSWPSIGWLGFALLIAASAKMSLLILVGIAPLIVIARWWRSPAKSISAVLIVLCVLYVGLLALYEFDARLLTSADLAKAVYRGTPAYLAFISGIFQILPIPRLLWEGCIELFFANAAGSPVYLFGTLYPGGNRYYFLLAMAVKLPHSFQILLLIGFVRLAWWIWKPELQTSAVFLLLPPVLYAGLASLSSFQLGLRLILPAFPFGMLIAGVGINWLIQRRRYLLIGSLAAWLAIVTMHIYPHGITYFNELAGGPNQGLRYLADSNLDWGQALRETAEFCHFKGIKMVKLSYFGLDIPRRYFAEQEFELIPPPWEDKYARGLKWEPEPGYYAISASLLPGFLFQTKYKDYYENFRKMQPIGRPGHAIYVYKVEK